MRENLLWVEKYRPKTVNDCVLPQKLKKTFLEFVANKDIPNMILSGPAGTGKTTIARALCNELNVDSIIINASEESGIDVLRNKIKQFASSMTLDPSSKYKVIILDEADYLNPQSTQPALRAFIEEFAGNCRFILTCNFKNRIISPLHSRCTVIDYTEVNDSKIYPLFMKRVIQICESEQIEYDKQAIADLIMKYAPDWRRVINELQRYSSSGKFSVEALVSNDSSIKSLIKHLKAKDFKQVRAWCASNSDIDPSVIFRKIYDGAYDILEPQSIPPVIILLADYQYKAAFCADQELNLVACLTEIMASATFK
jgi:DNA polymerase III delta prime subunit